MCVLNLLIIVVMCLILLIVLCRRVCISVDWLVISIFCVCFWILVDWFQLVDKGVYLVR